MENLGPNNATEILKSQEFKEAQFVRRAFIFPFVKKFNTEFYSRLLTFHEKVGFYIRVVLTSLLVILISLTLILNITGYIYVQRQVRDASRVWFYYPLKVSCAILVFLGY